MDFFHLFGDNQVLNATAGFFIFALAASLVGVGLYACGLFRDIRQQASKAKQLGRMLSILAGLTLVMSGVGKLIGLEPMVLKFTHMGLVHLFKFVGISEVIFGTMILIPATFRLGFLFGSALLAGAITSHLPIHSDGAAWAIPSGSVITLLWAGAFFDDTDVFPTWLTRAAWINRLLGKFKVA